MTILVTGGTGFIGSAVVRRLLAHNHRIRVLTRPTSDRRNLAGLAVNLVEGDLCDPASLRHAVAGCKVVFHVAADYRFWVPDAAAMLRINLDGTKELFAAALAARVERVIYTSSVGTLGLNPDARPADEATSIMPTVLAQR